ncbi:unnamed protein product [Phaedon cochleariae]|uniref:PSP proline-rich domain-containing protein n=1 Tax=Phaedon cochleariae TaxID=80249 RepID=A0A9P0DAB0_PHACE|nr:unnamed protein product [Phaedon cochleariae]
MRKKMKPQRPGKRKSPSRNVVFEVSDNDVSPEHSGSDIDEPEAKIFKPQSAFVESVVNALDDLEAEAACVEPSAELTSNIPAELTPANIPEVEQNVNTDTDNLPITRHDNLEVSSIDKVSNISSQVGIDKEMEVVEVEEKSEEVTPETNIEIEINEKKDEQMDKKIVQHIDSKMKEENTTLKSEVMMEISHPDETDQYIRISFSDETTSELYKFKFLKFLQTFVELEVESDDKLNISVKRDTLLNPTEWVVLDATMCLNEHEQNPVTPIKMPLKDKTPKKKKKKDKKDKGLFVLDPNPSASETNTYSIYSSKFNIDLATENEEQDNIRISTQTCFNCDGSHALKDCPAPKDFGRISAMRQKFKAQRQVSRYHLEDDQKYSHLVPGKISSQLREALGLKKKQLPFYIYRMRLLGYPPGWLEEAKSVNSNLNMFDADGNNVRHTVKQKQGLDPDKIVDFPGFNVPMDKIFEDEFRQHRVPPYSENYSKQVMLDYFEKQNANNDSDMDVDSPNDDSVLENRPKTISPVHVSFISIDIIMSHLYNVFIFSGG